MKKTWKRILYSLLALIVVAVVFVGWKAYATYNELDNLQKDEGESIFDQFESKPEYQPPEWTGTERVNILLMGADRRDMDKDEIARSDSMMIASFDPVTKQAHLFSILRDTYAEIPGYKDNRINTAVVLGGNELAMKTVSDLTGLDIQYYVYVDFQGFIKLVDAIGGVDFYVEKDMHYTDAADGHRFDIDLKEGQQHLDGEHALQYVRFRHDAMSDFTRTERQRAFLGAIADKLKSGWNLVKLPDIIGEVSPYIETNLSANDMLKLASLGYKSHQAGSAQLPPMELITEKNVGGASVIGIKDEDELRAYVQEVLSQDQTAVATPPASASSSAAGSGSEDESASSANE
ncbi:LCP family protein [Cohnella fermenti]|uniref:LytR family transcriptional regulator n=1 Tax=Cohnella fermenti TaxID=2565925 RepID=A0A4S4BUK5_9BACL|nr:LCP family protein [Cohnella fermenti]THF78755.1 LytR family transcriptional regulator [Cohnella fermenti]